MDQLGPHPHDRFFKALFDEEGVGRSFLESFLPQELVSKLDLTQLVSRKNSYVNEDLEDILTDAIFSVPLKGSEEEIEVSILLEHKSYIDRNAPVQLLGYLANGYRSQLRNDKKNKPILPVLYYHGKKEWNYEGLRERVGKAFPTWKAFIPDHETVFIDINTVSEKEIFRLQSGLLKAAMLVHKHSGNELNLLKRISDIMNNLIPYSERNFFNTFLVYTFKQSNLDKEKFIIEIEKIPEVMKANTLSLYDQLIAEGKAEGIAEGLAEGIAEGKAEGKAEGIAEGKAEGIAEGMAMIIRQLNDNGFSIEKIIEITKLNTSQIRNYLSS